MKALYTETFSDFLDRNEDSEVWQAIIQKFAKFPAFNLQALNFDMYSLFRHKYDIREIGAETESLFTHFIEEKLNESLIEYAPKINLYISNFTKLMDRKLTLTESHTDERVLDRTVADTEAGDETKSNYLNPIAQAVGTGSDKTITRENVLRDNSNNRDEDSTYTVNFEGTKEQAYILFKSNPELLEKALEIKNIYLEALNSFDTCFMGIY